MNHEIVERNGFLLCVFIVIAISFGSLAEIVPVIFLEETNEPLEGMQPLDAIALEGRDIYIREGCHVCHTQMIRPLRTETARYGHYSLSQEHVYEYPFLWGSKRTGPDLARIGGKYSDDWHKAHLYDPRSVVSVSNMPAFPWLWERALDGESTAAKMRAFKKLGVPYTQEQMDTAKDTVKGTLEIDALVAYLQQLGTHLPSDYRAGAKSLAVTETAVTETTVAEKEQQ